QEGLDGLEPAGTVEGLFPEPIRVFRVPAPLPRTYAVGGAQTADDEAARLVHPAFDPARGAGFDAGATRAAEPSATGSRPGLCRGPGPVRAMARAQATTTAASVAGFTPQLNDETARPAGWGPGVPRPRPRPFRRRPPSPSTERA